MSVSEIALLSNLSKAYISQVKSGIRPPSKKLLAALEDYASQKKPNIDHIGLFLRSREAMGCSNTTLTFYRTLLTRYERTVDYTKATRRVIEYYLNSIPPNENGLSTRHAYYRTLKVFYRWLNAEYGLTNPIIGISAPIVGQPILPSLTIDQVKLLLKSAECLRDRTIIALFTESGLRLSELSSIKLQAIDWQSHTMHKSSERAERRLMLHLVSSQSGISRNGLPSINLLVIFGA